MKYIFLILLFISFNTFAMEISIYKWSKRLLIVSASSLDDKVLINTKNFLSNHKCEVKDRNLEIIVFLNQNNNKFEKPNFITNQYGIWLLGYDGMVKDYSSDDSILLRLFDLIDSKPMRKNEIKSNLC